MNSENGKMDDMGLEEDLKYPTPDKQYEGAMQSIHLMNQSRQAQWARQPSNEQGCKEG
jgi:hypothetical protein